MNTSSGSLGQCTSKLHTTNPSVEVALADLEQTPDDFGDGGAIISNSHYNSTPDGNQSLRLSGVEGRSSA